MLKEEGHFPQTSPCVRPDIYQILGIMKGTFGDRETIKSTVWLYKDDVSADQHIRQASLKDSVAIGQEVLDDLSELIRFLYYLSLPLYNLHILSLNISPSLSRTEKTNINEGRHIMAGFCRMSVSIDAQS